LREKGLEQTSQRIDLARGNQEIAKTRLSQIPESGMNSLKMYSTGIDALQRVRKEFDNLRGEVGPVGGRISKAMLALGLGTDDPALAQLNANTIDALAQYIRSISGAQVHVSEFDRLRPIFPGIAQTPEQLNPYSKTWKMSLPPGWIRSLRYNEPTKGTSRG